MIDKEKHAKDKMKCGNCKHWQANKSDAVEPAAYDGITGLSKCMKTIPVYDVYEWSSDGDDMIVKELFKRHLAFTVDGSDYYSALVTKSDFGCVSFEPAGG